MIHIRFITQYLCLMVSPKHRRFQFYIYGSLMLGMQIAVAFCFPGSWVF